MTKKTLFAESEIRAIKKFIIEQDGEQDDESDHEGYENLDFIDAFIFLFKKWMSEKGLQQLAEKYPFSYLIKKYKDEFFVDMIGQEDAERLRSYGDDDSDVSYWDMKDLVIKAVRRGKHKFIKVNKGNFFDKFKRQSDFFIEQLDLPDWFNFEVSEIKPYSLRGQIFIDFPAMLKSEVTKKYFKRGIEETYVQKLINFLGVDKGNPKHGDLEFMMLPTDYKNVDSWVKNDLNKIIKKEIKQLPHGHMIHSIKFEPKENGAELKISFKWNRDYSQARNLTKELVPALLERLGYNKQRFTIEMT